MLAERVIEWTEEWQQQGVQKGFKKGIEQGIDQGIQQGRQEGEASLLLRLMERRFGSVDEATRHWLQTADAETLLRWVDRLLSAASAVEVLMD